MTVQYLGHRPTKNCLLFIGIWTGCPVSSLTTQRNCGIPWSGYPMKHTLTLDCWMTSGTLPVLTLADLLDLLLFTSPGPGTWEVPQEGWRLVPATGNALERKCPANAWKMQMELKSAHLDTGSQITKSFHIAFSFDSSTSLNRVKHMSSLLLQMRKPSGTIGHISSGCGRRPKSHPGCQALRPIALFLSLLENTALVLQSNIFFQKPLQYFFCL